MTEDVLAAFTLSQDRLAIVTSGAPALVLAGPGAGKTHLLVAHAAWLASEREGRVIMLTYTRKAADELRARAHRALAPDRRGLIVADTIHGYAGRLLRVHGHRLGLPAEVKFLEAGDVQRLADEVAAARDLDPMADFATRFAVWHRAGGQLTSPNVPPLARDVDARMRELGQLDWESCIRLATELLELHPDVLASVRHHDRALLVDEAQDCDRQQVRFLQQLVGAAPAPVHLFVVMDPDQSLYGFRDARPDHARSWALGHSGGASVEVTENFRCAARIQALARRILGKPSSGPLEPGVAELRRFADREAEAEWLVRELEERVSTGLDVSRMAVLARARHRTARLEERLRGRIEVRKDARARWTAPEQRVLSSLAFLKSARDDQDDPPVTRSFLVDVMDMDAAGAATIEVEAAASGCHPACAIAIPWWSEAMASLDGRPSPEAIVLSIAQLVGVEVDEELDALLSLARQVRGLAELLKAVRGGPAGSEAAAASRGLLVTTFHGAKGLEFDEVFVVGCEDGVVPDWRAKTPSAIEDERRALYVAVTRAGRRVVLTSVEEDAGRRKAVTRFLPATDDLIWSAGVSGNRAESSGP